MMTIAQLRTELTVTRTAVYTANVGAKNYQALADQMNASGGGVGGVTVFIPDIRAGDILKCLVWAEVAAATAAQWETLSTMLIPGTIDATNANINAMFNGLFTGAVVTKQNWLTASKITSPCRAEELWGARSRVSAQDVAYALTA